MFKNPFSFRGRIRRTEYGLSLIISAVARIYMVILLVGFMQDGSITDLKFIIILPFLWFKWAQGAKRCHDLGMSGWYQIIPLFPLYMLFASGEEGKNRFDENSKVETPDPVQSGLVAALILIEIKLIALSLGFSLYDINPFVFINMFLVTGSIAFSLYQIKRHEDDSNFLNDVKNGMTAGIPYTIVVGVFLYFYYQSIFPDYTQSKLDYIEQELNNPDKINEIKSSNSDLSNKSTSEIKTLMMSNTETMYSAKFTMVITLLGLTIFSAINSLIISFIYRRIVFRN